MGRRSPSRSVVTMTVRRVIRQSSQFFLSKIILLLEPTKQVVTVKRDIPIQEYRVGTWHSDLKISCRNVTLWSKNTVSERDTPIQEYRVRTWHSDPRISCQNVILWSNYTINLSFIITTFNSLLYYFHQSFFIQGITLIGRVREYKFYGLRISDQSQTTQPNHTITQSST